MKAKEKILIVGSSADTFVLKDGRKEATGYYLNELAVPAQAAVEAGYEIVLATPEGKQPIVDQHSLVADHFGGSEEALQKALDFVATNLTDGATCLDPDRLASEVRWRASHDQTVTIT